MRKRDTMICAAMTLFIAAFMALTPNYIASGRKQLTQRLRAENTESYQGIIRLWHIVGFKPKTGSLSSWLGRAASAVEKRHRGVYFEVEGMTAEEYEARRKRGERADVYSFPCGWKHPEELKPQETALENMRGNLAETGRFNGSSYAVPYATSGYFLAVNSRLMQEKGLNADTLKDAIRSGTVKISGDAVVACIYGASSSLSSIEDFKNEKAVAAFVDARETGDMERRLQEGKGFLFELYDCTNYTDLVQYIGVDREADDTMAGYIKELVEYVLAPERQSSLSELGLMPVAAESTVSDAKKLTLASADITAPSCFLYGTYREQLYESAAAGLSGSKEAKKDMDLRLKELVRGAAIK